MPKSTSQTLSPSRKWLFRLLAMTLGLIPLLALEGALRILGGGYDTRLVIPASGESKFTFNPEADRAYYGRGALPGPELRPFELPKPSDVFRVVVVGGSTVAGFPYPAELSFPRHLEVLLQEQNPNQRIEVLNAGVTAINSFSELDIVRQAVQCEPDLIIVHSGHNEFYGVGGLASTASGGSEQINRLLTFARRQRIVQIGASWLTPPLEKDLLEELPADISISLDSPMFQEVERNFQQNLIGMAAAAAKAGVPIMFTTVPVNARDLGPMSPLEALPQDDKAREEQAERVSAATDFYWRKEWASALGLFEKAARVDPGNALLVYRQAQCLEALQRGEEASRAYRLASDLDGCRFRAPSSFAKAVQQAAASAPETAYFCDVAKELQEASEAPAVGNPFLLEHVHYNIEGHWRVAAILAEQVQRRALRSSWRRDRIPSIDERDELLGLTIFDQLMGDSFALMALDTWPLSLAPDSRKQMAIIKSRMSQRYAGLPPLDRQIFAELSLAAMQQDLCIAMGDEFLAHGKKEKALAMFLRHTVRRPWEDVGNVKAARVLEILGRREEARETPPGATRNHLHRNGLTLPFRDVYSHRKVVP